MSLLYPTRNSDLAEDTPLSERQLARAEALLAARKALAVSKVAPFSRETGAINALDVLQFAIYIETGEDPYKPREITAPEEN